MKTIMPLLEQNYWNIADDVAPSLRGEHRCEVLIVGGGMAGLHAAHAFLQRGCKVSLIEKNFCGAGASGRSSGFITPDAEFSLHEFIERYGEADGKRLWEFALGGVASIRATIEEYALRCDMTEQDTCVVANNERAYRGDIVDEHETRKRCGYSSHLYGADAVASVVNSASYCGAIRYGGTFGINGYAYCQELKRALMRQGVQVYEGTPALAIGDHRVTAPQGTVQADHVILCVDRFLPMLDTSVVADAVFQVQTFLMMSEPLTDQEVALLFPAGPLMVWDTDLIYTYYRLTSDNRLMVGGGSLWQTYATRESNDNLSIRRQLQRYIADRFPQIAPTFSYFWAGLIGVSKDITPLAGAFLDRPWLYYVGAGAGLPWAAALGRYSAEQYGAAGGAMDLLFSPYRQFPVGSRIQSLIGKRCAFAISQGKTLFL